MSQHISKKYKLLFPIGSNISITDRKQESDKSEVNGEEILEKCQFRK